MAQTTVQKTTTDDKASVHASGGEGGDINQKDATISSNPVADVPVGQPKVDDSVLRL